MDYINLMMYYILVYRARRAEARIQQMRWKINFSDIVFINTVCVTLYSVMISIKVISKPLK